VTSLFNFSYCTYLKVNFCFFKNCLVDLARWAAAMLCPCRLFLVSKADFTIFSSFLGPVTKKLTDILCPCWMLSLSGNFWLSPNFPGNIAVCLCQIPSTPHPPKPPPDLPLLVAFSTLSWFASCYTQCSRVFAPPGFGGTDQDTNRSIIKQK